MRFAPALLAFAAASSLTAAALADCAPGDVICASVEASIQIGGTLTLPGLPFPPPVIIPPPPVIPPVVVVRPAPPPPPNVVIVVTQPQPMYTPPPPPAPVYAEPPQTQVVYSAPEWGKRKLALDLRLDGAGFRGSSDHSVGMWGAGVGLRYRAFSHLGFEAGFDVLGGRDYNDDRRMEYAGSAGALLYFNPRSRFQVYLSGGALLDKATAKDDHAMTTVELRRSYTHLGGYAGLGFELFLSQRIALHADARGVIRKNVGDGASQSPEFRDDSTGRTTNTSAGAVGSAGLLIYF